MTRAETTADQGGQHHARAVQPLPRDRAALGHIPGRVEDAVWDVAAWRTRGDVLRDGP